VLEGLLRSGELDVLPDAKKRVVEEAHFPLTAAFGLNLFSTQINLMLQYDAFEFSLTQVQSIADYFIEILRRMAETPGERHDARLPLAESERRRLLSELNDTARDYAIGCLHELFEAQVTRTPAAVAVMTDDASFI
jgi:microcystin synthetase protein McyA